MSRAPVWERTRTRGKSPGALPDCRRVGRAKAAEMLGLEMTQGDDADLHARGFAPRTSYPPEVLGFLANPPLPGAQSSPAVCRQAGRAPWQAPYRVALSAVTQPLTMVAFFPATPLTRQSGVMV